MDLQHIANLEAVAAAATPGRWITSVPDGFEKPWGVAAQLEHCTLDILCDTDADMGDRQAIANALFIATARQAVPELIHHVRKLQLFKDYVHARLDAAGIDKHEEQNALNGCRIGSRLDDVLASKSTADKFINYLYEWLGDEAANELGEADIGGWRGDEKSGQFDDTFDAGEAHGRGALATTLRTAIAAELLKHAAEQQPTVEGSTPNA